MQARGKPSHAQQINQLHELAKPKKKKEHQTNQDLEIAENSSEQIHDQTEPSTSKRYPENNKPINLKPIILLGDSIIKHIDPKKLSRRTVYKYTYPGKTCEEIKEAVDDLPTDLDQTCLNGSKLHLNGKGSSLLAVRFIKFLRAQSSTKQHDHTGERDFQMALLKQVGEMLTKIGRKRRT